MRQSVSTTFVLVATFALIACSGDSETKEPNQNPTSEGAEASDESNSNDLGGEPEELGDLPPATKDEATWRDVYRRCLDDGACMAWEEWREECVQLDEPKQSVCAARCTTVEDCVDLSGLPAPTFTAEVACKLFEGEMRCVLACEKDADCQATQACRDGVCVWWMGGPSANGD